MDSARRSYWLSEQIRWALRQIDGPSTELWMQVGGCSPPPHHYSSPKDFPESSFSTTACHPIGVRRTERSSSLRRPTPCSAPSTISGSPIVPG